MAPLFFCIVNKLTVEVVVLLMGKKKKKKYHFLEGNRKGSGFDRIEIVSIQKCLLS